MSLHSQIMTFCQVGGTYFSAFFFESLFSVSGSIEDLEGTFGMISSKGFHST